MRILVGAPRVPYPPTDGGRIVMFNAIRHLARLGHDVHVVAFAGQDEEDSARALRAHCASVVTVPLPARWQARALLADPPATLARYYSGTMRQQLEHVAASQAVDVVELESLHMAAYGPTLRSRLRVLRPQNVEHVVWERHASISKSAYARTVLSFQAARVRRYEARALRDFVDRTLAVSEVDRDALQRIAPTVRIDMLPMGIDTDYFAPIVHAERRPGSMVLTGSFDWAPKRHNLAVLVNEILPLIRRRVPAATLTIVGKGLAEHTLAEMRAKPGVEATGPVDDVRPYIARSSVVLNYVESGSGIAIKVLEAMAMARPVVSNALGVEGIKVTNGHDIAVAATKEEFADQAIAIMGDANLALRLGTTARNLVLAKYSAATLAEQLSAYFSAAVAEKAND